MVRKGVLRLTTISHLPGGIPDPVERLALIQSKYGLGDRRTVDMAVEFSGLGLYNRTLMLRNRCGNLDFVPFVEHPKGPYYIPRFDPVTFAPMDEYDAGSIYYNGIAKPMESKLKADGNHQEHTDATALAIPSRFKVDPFDSVNRSRFKSEEYTNEFKKISDQETGQIFSHFKVHNPKESPGDGVEIFHNFFRNAAIMAVFTCPVSCAMLYFLYRRKTSHLIRLGSWGVVWEPVSQPSH